MGATILVIALIGVVASFWLARQRLSAKPWLEAGPLGEFPGTGPLAADPAKIALGVFLAVVASLFALFAGAYLMRMQLDDWRTLPKPGILWVNTGILVLASGALVWAQEAAERGSLVQTRRAILLAAVASLAFLVGQVLAWRDLVRDGYFLATNPAATFFYLITGMHGLHLLGGLVALGRTATRAWGETDAAALRPSLDLCAIYWHFLLLVWCLLFSLFLVT